MKANMGTVDRGLRVLIALIVGYLYYNGTLSGVLGTVLLVFAVVFLLTSLVSFCPLYTLIGVKTNKDAGK
ncbi:DUF2892 domain-containing protein [Lacihabitans sp. LS3-19]|uniref:YgaP family membrane protein n=1 Tax=Lacihabitans sp. LS3-19 TaxID=2487335 RepID=UPI0020CD263C|nr:DUF2892 domain-containing protein [Lacihabitans sp. LS3-19]MCP9766944.1 DUF2892 domain-containing protein [Lacihabitans sp. LS3-19]